MNTDFDTTTRSAENQNRNGKGQWGGIAALTMLATFAFLTLIACYAWYGTDFLQRRDDAVGETLMREGKRREASFEYALALDFYQRALKARFNGPEHRTFTMERTGILLWQAGQAEDAAAILSEALTRDHVTTAPYSTLFEVLLHLNRTEEAAQLLETWKAVADTETDRAEQCHGAARLAEAQQHTKDAIKGYEHCVAAYD
ncbi:MAG: tetratricopeptide repeat protein, partial [Candidatus Hydrogenedentes bacterium]|nr:tetratricopeptide repeat protein [Candidatus Hydrogenedentota bacterium]